MHKRESVKKMRSAVTFGQSIRNPHGSNQFCTKYYWITMKEVSFSNIIMHASAQVSHQATETIPVFLSYSMSLLCAFSGAMSAFIMSVLLSQTSITFVQKCTRSPLRRRCCSRPKTLTAPSWSLDPGRGAACRAKSRDRLPAPSTMVVMMLQ